MIVAIAEENIGQVISVLRESATGAHRDSPGAALANVLDLIRARHIDNEFAAITVMVWSEALRNPALAAQLTAMRSEVQALYGPLATNIGLPEGMSAESFATVLGSISGRIHPATGRIRSRRRRGPTSHRPRAVAPQPKPANPTAHAPDTRPPAASAR